MKGYKIEGYPEKEVNVRGEYYDKKVDICIKDKEENVKGIVSIKFIMSNYK